MHGGSAVPKANLYSRTKATPQSGHANRVRTAGTDVVRAHGSYSIIADWSGFDYDSLPWLPGKKCMRGV